ncbi:MAG: nucleotidyl transferase AbiEii/AbiGii toxin family protein [Acidobacteriota bacterium]
MFERPQHEVVLAVLDAFRADVLAASRFLFGGGTRIVLDLAEYRVSQDIDFLCSDPGGYGDLRFEATKNGPAALFTPKGLERLSFPRELRVDQYGIRFRVVLGAESLKVELIREARIDLGPGVRPGWSPVDCLSLEDCFAEKLLANSDRWADRQILSRDLIDLAALRARIGPIPESAWMKVRAAYRSGPEEDLRKALSELERDPARQRQCFDGLQVKERKGDILQGLALLRQDLTGIPRPDPSPS